jgi:hypothetical protein
MKNSAIRSTRLMIELARKTFFLLRRGQCHFVAIAEWNIKYFGFGVWLRYFPCHVSQLGE